MESVLVRGVSILHAVMRSLLAAILLTIASLPAAARDITRESVLEAMNVHRANAGLPALRLDTRLTAASDDRMRDMEEVGYWSHRSPDGRSPFFFVQTRGYAYRSAGENLATGFETAELLVEAWMESPGHRANILSANYDDCGIAIIEGATTGRATGKSVVVLFAREAIGTVAAK